MPTTPYLPRGDCSNETKTRSPTATCPRCDEVPGAGVCPAPGSLADFALLFNRTYILCSGHVRPVHRPNGLNSPPRSNCERHRGGYWPEELHRRIRVFDHTQLNQRFARLAGPTAAVALGIVGQKRSRPDHQVEAARH